MPLVRKSVFTRKLTKNLKNKGDGPPNEFLMRIWKKSGLSSKKKKVKKKVKKKSFVKQYSWWSAASP